VCEDNAIQGELASNAPEIPLLAAPLYLKRKRLPCTAKALYIYTMKQTATYLLTCCIMALAMHATVARAATTKVVVRAKAKDAKFIGTSMGGAFIVIKAVATGNILAQGYTKGSTGNTGLIMKTPHSRYTSIVADGTAYFEADIDINLPVFVTIQAHSTAGGNMVMASTQVWLLPGKHLNGEGIILEIPGFAIDILSPQRHQFLSAQQQGREVTITANIVMMCGCTISKGGLWDGNQMQVEALVQHNGKTINTVPLAMGNTVNTFTAATTLHENGPYQIIVTAFDPKTKNTGAAQCTFIMND